MANEDPGHLAWVRTRPCSVGGCITRPCEADHTGPRGTGQKSHDWLALPMCREHHDQRTNLTGFFKDWTRERMRIWCFHKLSLLLERRAHALETGEIADQDCPV